MACRAAALALLALSLCGFTVSGGVQISGDVRTGVSSSGSSAYVSWAESDIAALESEAPFVYYEPPVDTSGWPVYDVTCEQGDGGCTPHASTDGGFPSSWGCSALVADGGDASPTDNAPEFRCMWWAGGAHGSDASGTDEYLLFFPGGEYGFNSNGDSVAMFRPDQYSDRRGIVGESRSGTILETTNIHPTDTQVNFLESENSSSRVWGGAAVAWNSGAGASKGATEIVVADSSNFTAPGWVYLTADPLAIQGLRTTQYRVRITSIDSGTDTLTIDRPIPDDFTGGNAQARPWTPAEQIVIRNMTIRMKFPTHQQPNLNWNVSQKHGAEWEISGVTFHGYQTNVFLEQSARTHFVGNWLSSEWDKPYNGYGIATGESSNLFIVGNLAYNHSQAFTCGNGGQGHFVGFNHFAEPEPNQPAYDRACDSGDGNDCVTDVSAHSSVHGETLPGAYYHCHSSDANEAAGLGGSASCHGTRVDVRSGALLLHGPTCHNSTFARNELEGGIWADWSDGPGRGHLLLGNDVRAGSAPSVGGLQTGGDFASVTFQGQGAYDAGYRFNPIVVGNSFQNIGGQFSTSFDAGIDVATFRYNVIRGTCYYNGGGSPNGAITAQCGSGSGPGIPVPAGASITWSDNTVGSPTAGWSATLPSAPGQPSSIVDLLGVGPGGFPFIGPDVVETCLPVFWEFNGGSC